jgi:hypothetical protein
MDPRRFERACIAFTRTMNRLRRQQRASLTGAARELAAVDRQVDQIIEAVKNGFRTERMKTELEDLEAKRVFLTQRLADRPLPSVHPKMAETYREKVTKLCDGFGEDASRDGVRGA